MNLIDDNDEYSSRDQYSQSNNIKINTASDYGKDNTSIDFFDFAYGMWLLQTTIFVALSILLTSYFPWYFDLPIILFAIAMIYSARALKRKNQKILFVIILFSTIFGIYMITTRLFFFGIYNLVISGLLTKVKVDS